MHVAPLTRAQLPAAVELLDQMRAQIGGTYLIDAYRAVCEDALRGLGPVVILASDDQTVAGISMALLRPAAYWESLIRRRPLLAARIALERRRLRGRVNRNAALHAGESATLFRRFVQNSAPPLPWTHAERGVARSIYLGVAPAHQARGLTRALFDRLFEVLSSHGCIAVDAAIDKSNVASLFAHRSAGWKLYEDAEQVYAYRELDEVL